MLGHTVYINMDNPIMIPMVLQAYEGWWWSTGDCVLDALLVGINAPTQSFKICTRGMWLSGSLAQKKTLCSICAYAYTEVTEQRPENEFSQRLRNTSEIRQNTPKYVTQSAYSALLCLLRTHYTVHSIRGSTYFWRTMYFAPYGFNFSRKRFFVFPRIPGDVDQNAAHLVWWNQALPKGHKNVFDNTRAAPDMHPWDKAQALGTCLFCPLRNISPSRDMRTLQKQRLRNTGHAWKKSHLLVEQPRHL